MKDLIMGNDFKFSDMIQPIQKMIEDFSEGLEMSSLEVTQRIIIDWMARDAAEHGAWGQPRQYYPEFVKTEDKTDLEWLFKTLTKHYQDEYEKEKKKLFDEELNKYKQFNFSEKLVKDLYSKFGYDYPVKDNN